MVPEIFLCISDLMKQPGLLKVLGNSLDATNFLGKPVVLLLVWNLHCFLFSKLSAEKVRML